MNGKAIKTDRCIVVAPRHETAKNWIRSYFANGNTSPLVIVKGNGEWADEDQRFCSSAAIFSGGSVIECRSKFSDVAAIKTVAEDISPKTWAYVGDSTLVVGNVDGGNAVKIIIFLAYGEIDVFNVEEVSFCFDVGVFERLELNIKIPEAFVVAAGGSFLDVVGH